MSEAPNEFTYRKKPVEVEAFQMTAEAFADTNLYPKWLKDALATGVVYSSWKTKALSIRTLEGEMKITNGDFIIRGVAGEIYPCKPEIFQASYEKVQTQ